MYLSDRYDDGPQVGEWRNPPFWIDGRESGNNLIACRNGLLDLETKTLTPTARRSSTSTPCRSATTLNAPTPKRWIKFLRELWPGDEGKQSRMTLQEIFGLMLIADTSYQKIFLIIGPKRSGKGTIGRVLRRLIGTDNIACPTMASLGGEYGLWPLIDKRVAIISDARVHSQDAQKVAERLLSISGEDGINTNRKYQSFWVGQLGARFLIMSNRPPRIADASGALVSRYILLTMTESFFGREQKDLTEALYMEMPGILNWAIRGLERLRKRDGTDRQGFIIPKQSRHMIKALEEAASPIGAFVGDWCVVGPEHSIVMKDMYRAWQYCCKEQGDLKPGPFNHFSAALSEVIPGLRRKGRNPKRRYVGVALSEQGEKALEEAVDRESARRRGGW